MGKRGALVVVIIIVAGLVGYWGFSRKGAENKPVSKALGKQVGKAVTGKQLRPERRQAAAHGAVTRKRDGAPVVRALVQLMPTDEASRQGQLDQDLVVETDAKGRWKLGQIPPGQYSMSVTAVGFLPVVNTKLSLRGGSDTALDAVVTAGGNALSGTVSDLTGGTIGTALIRLTPILGVLQPRQGRGFAAISNDKGHYQLHVPDGRYRITASHEAYVASARIVELRGAKRTIDFALSPGGVIEGTVLSAATGKPIGEAIVRYSREAVRSIPGLGAMSGVGQGGAVKADKSGRFRVRGLGAGAIKLRAHAAGSSSRDAITVPLAIAERVSNIELFLVDAYSIRGTVVVKTAGTPAAGVWVTAHARGGVSLSSVTRTGSDGSFELGGALPGRYVLRVHGGNYVTADVGTPVTVKEQHLTGVTLHVSAGAMVSGRVEPATAAEVGIKIGDAGGKTMAGGRMLEMLRVRSSVQTNADGTFEIGPVRPGALTIVAKAADGRKGELAVDVPAGGAKDLVIALEDKASVSGRVVDEDGKPVTDATVSLKKVTPGRHTTMIVNGRDLTAEQSPTHEDGSFKIVGLDEGDYQLSVKEHGGTRLHWASPKDKKQPSAPLAFTVEARKHHTGVTLRVEARNHTITGVVLGPDGKAARDVWVNASAASKGPRFGGAPMPPPPGPPGGEKVERRTMVMTMVMDEDDGGHGGGGMGMASSIPPVLTNEQGEFEFTKLRKGDYNLMGEGLRGSARGFVAGVKTGSKATIKLVSLTKIKGLVTQAGKPVASFKVELSGAGNRSKWVRDAAGAFTLHRVDPGKYTVEITADAGSAKSVVIVEAGKTAEVTIALETLSRVTGTLVDPKGNPVANAKLLTGNASSGGGVQIEMVDGDAPAMSGADGRFELRLGKGGKVLLVMGEDKPGPRVMHTFEVKAGEDLDLGQIKTRW